MISLNEVVKALDEVEPGISKSRRKIKVLNAIGTLIGVLKPEERERVLEALAREVDLDNGLKSLEAGPRARLKVFWAEARKKILAKPKIMVVGSVLIAEVVVDDPEYADVIGNALKDTVPEFEEGEVFVYAGDGVDDYLVQARARFKSEDGARKSAEFLRGMLSGARPSPNGGV